MTELLGPDERREIGRLRRALALRQGPDFHMIVGDTRRVVDAAVAEVLPGVDVPPITVWPEEAPKPFAVRWMQRLEDAIRTGGTQALVLDAWDEDPEHVEHWGWVFGRVNERRNEVMRGLGRPLLLLLSPNNERLVGRMAPDLWSIRGVGMRLQDRSRSAAEDDIVVLRARSLHSPRSSAPARLDQLPPPLERERDATPSLERAIAAIRASQGLHEARRDDEAIAAADEAIAQYEALAARDAQERIDLARALRTRAEILAGMQRLDAALDDMLRSTSIIDDLLRHEPRRSDLLHELRTSHGVIGDIHLAQGRRDRARSSYERAAALAEPRGASHSAPERRSRPGARESPQELVHGLADELARIVYDSEAARLLALRAGFPASQIPAFSSASVFWNRVLADAYNGVLVGGLEPLVSESVRLYPGNTVLREYLDRLTKAGQAAPSVFVSHGHDSAEHVARVRALADRLRGDGLDVRIDLYVPPPPEGWPEWIKQQTADVDFVLVVCTASYRRRFEALASSTAEGVLAQQLFYAGRGRPQGLLPVLLPGSTERDIPRALGSYTAYTLPDDYDRLYRRMTQLATHALVSP